MKTFLCAFFCATTLSAAPMARVIEVRSSTSLLIDRNGTRMVVTLAQVAVAPSDEAMAIAYLKSELTGGWVMIENDPRGGSHLFRSPDALYVNGAIARRAYLDGRVPMTYLGHVDPAPPRATKEPAKQQPKKPQRAPRRRR